MAMSPPEPGPIVSVSDQNAAEKPTTEQPTKEDGLPPASENNDAPYCVLPEGQKIFIMMTASFAGVISPLSSSIYFPALNSLANAMHVSIAQINLTIMMYLIFQGLSPSVLGTFSDVHGRRPAYMICFVTYMGANIGLALQNNYAALMVLRCLQACGSSVTIAIGSAVVADVSTRAERGKYIGYATMGTTLGPALGPVIGGLLDHFLGWRWIFWFLVIVAFVFFLAIVMFFPETCRVVVGNGSIPAPTWNQPLWKVLGNCIRLRRSKERSNSSNNDNSEDDTDTDTRQPAKRRPNPLTSVKLAAEKEAGLILIYGALLFSGYMIVTSTLSTQLADRFGFNSIQIGLCYLPIGIGSLTSRWTIGFLLDWNFKREAQRQGLAIERNRQQEIDKFDIERARLAVTIPAIYASCLCFLAYGWVMQFRTSLAGPVIMLFFSGHLVTGSFTALNTLVVDTHKQSPATAIAANNLLRCLLGAGATAIAAPLIDRIGIGWTATFIAGVWVVSTPCLWAVYFWGHGWREKQRVKEDRKKEKKERANAC